MKLRAPSICPVCGEEYEITKLTCKKCQSELGGNFTGCEFCQLNDEESYFVLTFLKCRGNIKDVEKELKISYPTVRGKLDGVLKKLDLVGRMSPDEIREERKGIFDKLNNGEVSADQAAELLKNL